MAALRAKALTDLAQRILARPLFAPSRRPLSVVAIAAAPQVVAALPRLAGLIFTPTGSLAMFAPVDGKVVTLAQGDNIGSYVVRSISPNTVVLSGPAGQRELRTSFVRVTPHVIHADQEASAQ
jgi:hypothetical protein